MLAEGAAAAALADPSHYPGSLQRKLPPGRKTALSMQTSTRLEGKKASFLHVKKQEDSSTASEGFNDLQKNHLSLVPSCFFSVLAV